MSKEYFESLERLAMPDELHIKECKKLGIGLTEDYDVVEQALQRLESIDNANPSEALECLESVYYGSQGYGDIKKHYEIVKQALLKAQEPKHYLTWETLPFKKKSPECPRGVVGLNAKMGDTPLKVFCSYSKDGIHHYVEIYRVINDTLYIFMNLLDDENDEEYKLEPQLFNDLHLEAVE